MSCQGFAVGPPLPPQAALDASGRAALSTVLESLEALPS
jgi:hypothetical protein